MTPDTIAPHRRLTGRVVIATHNPGKLAEMRDLLLPFGVAAVSASELNLAEPNETGTTFRDNACIKAQAAAKTTGLPALADDSGLAVEALGGAPGIHSARWAGPDKDFFGAMQTIENKLQALKTGDRRAHFVSALCIAWPDGHVEEFEARVDGVLVWPPRGDQGFGYDPVFLPDGHNRTFGEMDAEEKHGLPARHQAEWAPVSRPDGASFENAASRSDAKPVAAVADRAPRGQGLSHRVRAFLMLAQACLERR